MTQTVYAVGDDHTTTEACPPRPTDSGSMFVAHTFAVTLKLATEGWTSPELSKPPVR